MSSAIFRQLASGGEAHRPERLFRAAVSAFTSLTRPTRREIAQLDDLTLPLFASVPVETRRYAAALLCESASPPPGLLRRLCDEPVEISAPLLMRSKALGDVDLIGIIARNGLPHARVIGRRAGLNPAIAALVRALATQAGQDQADRKPPARTEGPAGTGESAVRERLRGMMRAAGPGGGQAGDAAPGRQSVLRAAAFSSDENRFAAALAGELGISAQQAGQIVDAAAELMVALRALGTTDAEALLLTATRFPQVLAQRAAIRLFVERYRAIAPEMARARLLQWKPPHPPLGTDRRDAVGHSSAAISK